MWQQLGVDLALANAPRDQLRVLASEIEHEDLLMRGLGRSDFNRILDTGRERQRRIARLQRPPRAILGTHFLPGFGLGRDERAQPSVMATPFETLALPLDPIPTCCERCSCLPSV